jgi:hypothetical protein
MSASTHFDIAPQTLIPCLTQIGKIDTNEFKKLPVLSETDTYMIISFTEIRPANLALI